MAPIRTAIIGLSSSAKTSWASSAHLPYLISPRGRERYSIVALCNSSVDAARRAVEAYNLPADTKTYGDPQSLADDPDIDLVVCCTRVDVHHPTILPSVKAGKNVFVEWPLAHDVEHAKELTDIANSTRSRSMIGLQGRLAPPVVKIQEVLEQGRIGKVLSSEVRGSGGTVDRDLLAAGLEYFTDKAIGGNMLTIGFGHLFDQVQHVLGKLANPKVHLQIQRPDVKLRNPQTNEIVGTKRSNVPDLVIAAGSLVGSQTVQEGASLHLRFRRGQPYPGEPALVWTVTGEKGELRLEAPGGTTLHAVAYSKPVNIQVHDFATDKVEEVNWAWEDWQEELPIPTRSVAKLYENWAKGGEAPYPSFEDATSLHSQLSGYLADWAT